MKYRVYCTVTATVTEIWEVEADSVEQAQEALDGNSPNCESLQFIDHDGVEDETNRTVTSVEEIN